MLVAASLPAQAGRECDAPPETWRPRSEVSALAERNGWRLDRLKVDDGCYEVSGRDAQGRRFKAKIDPASLQVIRIRHEHREREREREHSAAPPPGAPTGLRIPARSPPLG